MAKEFIKQGLTPTEYRIIHSKLNILNNKLGKCFLCGCNNKKTEWALIAGRKYTQNIEDYMELCRSCHRKYDWRDRKYDKQALKKMSIAAKKRTGSLNSVSKLLINIENGIFYESITEASKAYGISTSMLSFKLSGKFKNNTPLRYA